MKKLIILMSVLFSTTYMVNVYPSEEFDIATMTCRESSKDEDEEALIIWLDGYLTAAAGRTESSERDMEALGNFIETECRKDPNQTILSIIEKL